MKTLNRTLIATLPVAALLLSPALATAHPNNDTDVTVSATGSTVTISIYNYHPYAIDCVTSVTGGVVAFTVGATATNFGDHTGVPAGTATATWSCTSDNGATSHSSGSKSVTVQETAPEPEKPTYPTFPTFPTFPSYPNVPPFPSKEKIDLCKFDILHICPHN